MVDIPKSRHREDVKPQVTYYMNNADNSKKVPKQINGIVVKLSQNGSRRSISNRKRSMSASSASSNKSFKASRKRPPTKDGDEVLLMSKYRASENRND